MSCPTATAPIDISSANITGKCDLKCAYQFKYTSTSCTATNRGHYLSLACDRGAASSVQWNQSAYSVDEVRLYTPSLHSFSGTRAAGEAVILHVSNTGANPFFVCVPIQLGAGSGAGSSSLQSILNAVAKNAPADGDSTAVRMSAASGFNLTNWVPPSAPFYSYTATEPFQPCSGEVDYVVFDASASPIYVSDADMSRWTEIVKPHPYDIKPVAAAAAGSGGGGGGVRLFYNAKGPNQGGAANNDEIYIDCQPVGVSEETQWVATGGGGAGSGSGGGSQTWDWGHLLENKTVQMILCILLFFMLLFGMRWLLDWVGTQMPQKNMSGGGRVGGGWWQ